MGSAICLRTIHLCLYRSIPCLLRSTLANGGAVRGLGRDCNCREYSGCSGDIFFIVIRQKFHSENPPRISEMADGGYHRETIAAEYASRIRPRTDNGKNLSGIPTVGMPIIFRKNYKNVTHFHKEH
jgi:hypothetical protein